MDDMKMLELAAKAAGIDWTRRDPIPAEFDKKDGRVYRAWGLVIDDRDCWLNGFQTIYWNPLVDDGDAFRLAVKLDICMLHEDGSAHTNYVTYRPEKPTWEHVYEFYGDDKCAAFRRAIVRAAAAIGVEMEDAPREAG